MMHSWASRSSCCAWEACSDSSSGLVHPAEPSVASSWGPVTHTQGMSQPATQQSIPLPHYPLLSLPLFDSREWKKQSWQKCLTIVLFVDLKSRGELDGGLEMWEPRRGQDRVDKGVKQHEHHAHWDSLVQIMTSHKHRVCNVHSTPTQGWVSFACGTDYKAIIVKGF